MAALAARDWPGNVRELENAVARLVALSDGGVIALDALALPESSPEPGEGGFRARVDAFERQLIEQAFAEAGGNRAEAARRLGLSRVTLLDRMKRLGLG